MQLAKVCFAVVMALVLLGGTAAGADSEVTLTGSVLCAKCTLKKADAKVCQDVLVVEGAKAGEYYLVKNAALEKFGHTCNGKRQAKATGAVSEKDGKKWLDATIIEPVGT